MRLLKYKSGNKLQKESIKDFLESKVVQFNEPGFIKNDPISIPHQFSIKEDIEIIGLITATISWGNRKSIINSANKLVEIFNEKPYEFVMHYSDSNYDLVKDFKHRTFNGFDLHYFILSLQNIYLTHGGLENIFEIGFKKTSSSLGAIENFRNIFLFKGGNEVRTKKHVSSPLKGSAAKRLNMFLRWMVRNDANGVDFGIWKNIPPSLLSCPLDVHSGNSARNLRLLNRNQNDWKAVVELDTNLRILDPNDPVKYDFALFGMGLEKSLVKY